MKDKQEDVETLKVEAEKCMLHNVLPTNGSNGSSLLVVWDL